VRGQKLKGGENMIQPVKMYADLRKYLSPIVAYDLVKAQFPKLSFGMMDLEIKRLQKRF
jgi:hypothetical protein